MEWQTMETAPRDGTTFLAMDKGLIYSVAFTRNNLTLSGYFAIQSRYMKGISQSINPILWTPFPKDVP